MPPENTSWKIRMKGITVIAAVVVCARLEIKRESMSAAKVMRKIVNPISRVLLPVNMPSLAGNFTPIC